MKINFVYEFNIIEIWWDSISVPRKEDVILIKEKRYFITNITWKKDIVIEVYIDLIPSLT